MRLTFQDRISSKKVAKEIPPRLNLWTFCGNFLRLLRFQSSDKETEKPENFCRAN